MSTSTRRSAGLATAQDTRLKARLKSGSFWLIAIVVFAAAATAVLWPTGSQIPLDPENRSGNGTRALARVLAKQGIDVTVIHDTAAAATVPIEGPTTLVVSQGRPPSAGQIRRIAQARERFDRVVYLGLSSYQLRDLGIDGVRPVPAPNAQVLTSDCSEPAIGSARKISLDFSYGDLLETSVRTAPSSSCFLSKPTSITNAGAAVVVQAGSPQLIAVPAGRLASNGKILQHDNGALMLTLLGNNPKLVWLSLIDEGEFNQPAEPEPGGLTAVLPDWWDAVQKLLTWTALAAVVWQARRFGPLITEPLPVVIKAIETTVNRGQLYHRARARDSALASLQRATRKRLTRRLSLPADLPPADLVRAVAAATKRTPDEIHLVLFDSAQVSDDGVLVTRAQTLATLEEEVRP